MRGNELIQVLAWRLYRWVFQIPMRGNEMMGEIGYVLGINCFKSP